MRNVSFCSLIVLGLAVASDLSAASFYVDATKGDDAREGRDPVTAWRSLARVNRARLMPGDRVLFQRGQAWRGQLMPQSGDASGVVTYGAFGEGAKPLLLGSVAADRAQDWIEEKDGVWATTPVRFEQVGVQRDLRQAAWWMHQEAGAACRLTTEQAGANGKGLLLSCSQPGTRANHIQLSAPGFAVQEGHYYLFTFQASSTKPFLLTSLSIMKESSPWTSYATVEGLPLAIGTNWGEYTVRFLARQSAQDARLTLYLGGTLPAGAMFHFRPGQLFKAQSNQGISLPVDVGNIIFDHGRSTGVKKWSEADLRELGDYFYDGRTGQVKLRSDKNPATNYKSIELALRRHIIDQSNRGYVLYENLDLRYGAAHGIGGSNTRHITVRGCDLSFIGGGHQFTRPDGKPVRFGNAIEFWSSARDCLVEDCRIWEIYDAALTNQGDGTNVQENIIYRRNVIWNSEYSFEYWNRGPASHTRNIRFEHNTCVDAGKGWGHKQRPDPNGQHLMFYDNSAITSNVVVRSNIFCNSATTCLRLSGRDWTRNLSMDYNCWFQSEGPVLRWGNELLGKTTFQNFLKNHNLDTHSIFADPKFVAPENRDYSLAPDSPARQLF